MERSIAINARFTHSIRILKKQSANDLLVALGMGQSEMKRDHALLIISSRYLRTSNENFLDNCIIYVFFAHERHSHHVAKSC